MNKFVYFFVGFFTFILGAQPGHADKLKAYVPRFSVSISEHKEELQVALQTMLMSRLNSTGIQAVENPSDADIQIIGSYIAFGTVFSLDTLVKTSTGVFIDRAFTQGDTESELIPSLLEMSWQLQGLIRKWQRLQTGDLSAIAAEKAPPVTTKKNYAPQAKAVKPPRSPAAVKLQKLPEKPWVSQRLPETLYSIASGRIIAGKGVEIFITGERYLRYYLKRDNLQFVSVIAFEADEKIIGVDVADLNNDGVTEIYVTLLKNGLPASQIYLPENDHLLKVKDNIPYMLRSIALAGKQKKIFAQKMESNGNFSGDIFELVKDGDDFTVKNPLQSPLFGNLFNLNSFFDSKGKQFFIVAHPEGYLLVYSHDKKQLWKSRDKFGGSEASHCQPANSDQSPPPLKTCTLPLPRRLLVTEAGDVIVSRNTGLSTSSAGRNYSKSSAVQFFWDGASLQEKQRTEQSLNYLADFSYDDNSGELLLLEVEPAASAGDERGSRVVVKRLP